MSVWIFWGFIYTAFLSLVASEFQASGANLTALYGMLALSGSALGSLVSAFVFPILVRIVRLGSVLLVCSGLASVVGFSYISFRTFTIAVVVYLCFELSAASFKALAVNTEIGLYPSVIATKFVYLEKFFLSPWVRRSLVLRLPDLRNWQPASWWLLCSF